MKESCLQGCFCSKEGFTLIELLVVVLIIGFLAAVAVPQYQKAVEKSRATELYALLASICQAQQVYYLANGEFTKDFKELDIEFPYDDGGKETTSFEGGGYSWRKSGSGDGLFALKNYKDGLYGLGIYYMASGVYNIPFGEPICITDAAGKALEMCQSLGYNVEYADDGYRKYYKK